VNTAQVYCTLLPAMGFAAFQALDHLVLPDIPKDIRENPTHASTASDLHTGDVDLVPFPTAHHPSKSSPRQ